MSREALGNPRSGCQSRPSLDSAPNNKAARGRPTTTRATTSQIMTAGPNRLGKTSYLHCRLLIVKNKQLVAKNISV